MDLTSIGSPSQEITRIISRNPDLRNLHLRLAGTRYRHDQERHEAIEVQYTLEDIGQTISSLAALTLEGKLHFTERAWSLWESTLAGLDSLSILTDDIAQELAAHNVERILSIKSLRLDRGLPDPRRGIPISHRTKANLKPFLSSPHLNHLSLSGCHPENLSGLQDSARGIRRFLFHVPETAFRPCSPTTTHLLLSPQRLELIGTACPQLEWMACDVHPFHLEDNLETGERFVPTFGHSLTPIHQLEDAILSSMPTEILLDYIPVHQVSSEAYLNPVFASLTAFRSLRHLRLFVHHLYGATWTFDLTGTMRTFLWLQKHKSGSPLESLVIYSGPVATPDRGNGPWIVYDMGGNRLCTTEGAETHLWNVQDSGEFELFDPLGTTARSEAYIGKLAQERLHILELDRDGYVVPIQWT